MSRIEKAKMHTLALLALAVDDNSRLKMFDAVDFDVRLEIFNEMISKSQVLNANHEENNRITRDWLDHDIIIQIMRTHNNCLINDIKCLRAATGWGLKESKDFAEYMRFGEWKDIKRTTSIDIITKIYNQIAKNETTNSFIIRFTDIRGRVLTRMRDFDFPSEYIYGNLSV